MKPSTALIEPERIAKLPHYKGLPVTATTLVDDNGIPNFKIIDSEVVWKLKQEHKCAICGEALDYWIAFMVDPKEAESRLVFESPQHEECLRHAFKICPWLYYSKATYTDPATVKIEGYTFQSSHPNTERPDKLGIYICRSYENVMYKGYRVCKVSTAKRIEWIESH